MLIPSRTKFVTLLLCLFSGLLGGAAFPPFEMWILIYPALGVLLFLISSSGNFRQTLGRAYLFFLSLNIFTLYWISSWGSNDNFIKIGGIAVILIHPVFFLIPVILYYSTLRNLNIAAALIMFPFFWTGFEYFHNIGQLAYPWIELGNTETYNLDRVQYIDYTGLHGITFLIASVSVMIFYLVFKINSRDWKFHSRKSIVFASSIILLIVLPNIYSAVKKYNPARDVGKIKSSAVQTNIDPWRKWNAPVPELADTLVKKLELADVQKPDVIVLHETAAPFYFFSPYYAEQTNKFTDFVNKNNTNVLMGIPYMHYYTDSNTAPKDSRIMKNSGKRYDQFNSAVLLNPRPDGSSYTIYSKTKLVPVSERIPYQEYFPFLEKILKWRVGLGSWQIGQDTTIFKMKTAKGDSVKFAAVICYESAFSEYVSQFVKKGAQFLVIITNDGWFGNSSGPYQHQQFAVLRAIENRKWIIRSAQTGISCFIDPLGNTYDKTELNTAQIITREITPNNEQTFYSLHGDLVGKVSYAVSVIMLVLNGIVYLRKRVRNRA